MTFPYIYFTVFLTHVYRYVVPAPLEDMLTRSQYIAQAFVFGDNKPYNVTLIVPDLAEVCAN
jgi:long-subunit acyl-CoA synthetase (AMP-forming)